MDFACIYVPDFMVQTVVRVEPTLRPQAVALVDGAPPLLRVVGVNEKARQAGVRSGMTQLQAAELLSVEIRRRSPAQETAARAALLDCAYSCSPIVEDTAADTVLLDLTGVERLFNSPEQIVHHLTQRASDLGLEVHIALARNPEAALHAARGFPGITLISPGHEAERLGGLPVEVLAPPQEIFETLSRWGVRTFRELALLPAVPLSERLGQEGLRLQKLARGIGLRSLVRAEPAPHFEEALELDYPVMELEPLLFILSRLLDQLCLRLAARALATQELRLRLELERSVDGQQSTVNSLYETVLRLPVPMRDSKVFLKLLHLRLKSDPPPAPILKVRITAQPAKPRVAQHGLFLPLSPDPEKLEVTLARIAGLVGKENIGSPQLVDTHRFGAFRMNPFNPLDYKGGARTTPTTLTGWSCPPAGAQGTHLAQAPTMALRVFRPPRRATVELRAGRPARVFASGARGEVLWAAGPWRTSGDWWRADAWEHDEWDILLAKLIRGERMSVASCHSSVAKDNGLRTTDCRQAIALYRIYRDLASGSWFVLGSYD